MTERDKETGLDHTWWRKYDHASGRWTSPDPYNGSMSVNDPQSFNRYAYVGNDPVNFVDPSGLNAAGPGTTYSSGMLWTLWHLNEDGRTYSFVRQWFEPYGNEAALSEKDAKKYEKERLAALGRLAFSTRCRDFLTKHGVNVKDLISAVAMQRPHDGRTSTLTRGEAGVVDPNDSLDVQFSNVALSNSFTGRGHSNAQAAIYPGGALGATLSDRSDVYYRPSGIYHGTILHEALHSLLGETDTQLQKRFGIGDGVSSNITQKLKDEGCAE